MPKINAGSSATVSIPAGSVISVSAGGGLLRFEYPTGTVLFEGDGADQTFGPYPTTANSTITSLMGGIDYVVSTPPAAVATATVAQASVNLLDTAAVRDGKFLNSGSGQISSSAGWGCSAFIPVTAGQQYTISGTRGRHGVGFFTAASDASPVAGSYLGTLTLPLTVTAPTGAAYMVVNLYSASAPMYSNVQVEPGVKVTAYIPYGQTLSVPDRSMFSTPTEVAASSGGLLVLDSAGTSYLQTRVGGDTFQIQVTPFAPTSHSASQVFNFNAELFNGVQFKSSTDDVAPYRVFATTIGANHGYAKTICTVATHNKTLVDVGSVWTDGTNQWVIVEVPSTTSITITARTSNNAFTSGTLTHVSGAAHTTSFTPTGVSQASSWYQVFKNRSLAISVDGVPVTARQGRWNYEKNVTFSESYEIMNKSSIVEWLITQVGTATDITSYSGTSDLSVSMAYVFDTQGGCAIFSDFLALNAVTNFQDIMFTQAFPFAPGMDGAVKYYIPKTTAFTHESVSYDFRSLRDMTGFSVVSRIDFDSTRTDATGQLADRALMFNNSTGMAVGYLPVQDADPAVRRTRASTKALQISEVAKIYMSCIDSASKTSLAAGDYYSAIAYRVPFRRPTGRTASYFVRTPEAVYLYCDWHVATVDRVALPPDLQGRAYTVVEKSSNVTVRSAVATTSLVFDVSASGSYGYAVIRFDLK